LITIHFSYCPYLVCLSTRSHVQLEPTTACIVQGSGIGPYLFIIYAMVLKCVSCYNTIVKYADDTILLVPQNSSVSLEEEFAHIIDWSYNSKLTVNTPKTMNKLSSVALAFQINSFHLFFLLRFSELIPSSSFASICHTLFLLISTSTICSLNVTKDYNIFSSNSNLRIYQLSA